MPKPMRLMVDVEEIAYGRVFRMLDGSDGVVSITPVGEGPRSQRANGGIAVRQKKGGALSVPCVVLKTLIRAGEPMLRFDIGEALVSAGKTKNGLAPTMKDLLEKKEVTRSGAGKKTAYKVTPKGIKRFETACEIQQAKE